MNKYWSVKKLKDLCIIRPQKSEAKRSLDNDDYVSFLPMEDLGVAQKEVFPVKERRLSEVYGSYTYFAENDLLVAKITPCFENGKVGIARSLTNKIGFGSSEYFVLRPSTELLPEYLYYYFNQDRIRRDGINAMTGAVGHKRVSKDFIENLDICYPESQEEQRRIVSILDESFAAIAKAKVNAEKNLQNARELFESYLQSVFANPGDDWEEKTLEYVCDKITDGTHNTPTYTSAGIPFITVKNLTNGIIDFSDTKFISIQEHNALTKRCKPEKEDILYTKVGTTGIAKVVDVEKEFSIFVSVALLKIKHGIIFNKYLEYFLNSPFAREQAKKRTRGTANKNLVIKDIKQIIVRYPRPLIKQKNIVTQLDAYVTESQRLESIYKKKLDDLEELKKSILQKAFNGVL